MGESRDNIKNVKKTNCQDIRKIMDDGKNDNQSNKMDKFLEKLNGKCKGNKTACKTHITVNADENAIKMGESKRKRTMEKCE